MTGGEVKYDCYRQCLKISEENEENILVMTSESWEIGRMKEWLSCAIKV